MWYYFEMDTGKPVGSISVEPNLEDLRMQGLDIRFYPSDNIDFNFFHTKKVDRVWQVFPKVKVLLRVDKNQIASDGVEEAVVYATANVDEDAKATLVFLMGDQTIEEEVIFMNGQAQTTFSTMLAGRCTVSVKVDTPYYCEESVHIEGVL